MASSSEPDSTPDLDDAAVGEANTPVAAASASAAPHDVIPMAVGTVMALHSVDRWTATTALNGAAHHLRIPVSAAAHALLTLVAGTDEPIGDAAGRAAAQLLVQGYSTSP